MTSSLKVHMLKMRNSRKYALSKKRQAIEEADMDEEVKLALLCCGKRKNGLPTKPVNGSSSNGQQYGIPHTYYLISDVVELNPDDYQRLPHKNTYNWPEKVN